jgi:hypothetical protein
VQVSANAVEQIACVFLRSNIHKPKQFAGFNNAG